MALASSIAVFVHCSISKNAYDVPLRVRADELGYGGHRGSKASSELCSIKASSFFSIILRAKSELESVQRFDGCRPKLRAFVADVK